MNSLEEAKSLMSIFEGSDLAFGRTELTEHITTTGKHEAKCWMEKRPVTEEDWKRHIEGIAALGIPPINSQSMVKFGAIDVDQYQGLSLEDLCRDISRANLPLVVCRSKSGGPHIYLFVEDWVPARQMVEKLDGLAAYFGFGTSEIFPKQVTIGTHNAAHKDYGNWINMPYFNRDKNFRVGLDENGEPITKIEDFITFVQSRTIPIKLLDTVTPLAEDGGDKIFPGGPPCLNNIFAKGKAAQGNRNIVLFNVATYTKKAFPDNWENKLDEYNRLLETPLPGKELEAMKKSHERKEYYYKCRESPLCDYCNSQVCSAREHGVGSGKILPNNRSLTCIRTSPSIWYLDITPGDGSTHRISLSTDELQSPHLFQKRCMDTICLMPPIPKREVWADTVRDLMKNCTVIEMPYETTPQGQLKEHLEDFVIEYSSTKDPKDMLRGNVYSGPKEYWFRWVDFKKHLEVKRFDLLKQHEILAVLRSEFKAMKGKQHLAGRFTNFLKIPKDLLVAGKPEDLPVAHEIDVF